MDDYPYYSGKPDTPAPAGPRVLRTADRAGLTDSAYYLAGKDLVRAANVALLLGQPLLLTGEPGTGKTQFAYSLAHELGYGEPHKFATKSISTATDLFYTFNALSRFNAAYGKIAGSVRGLEYFTFNALGLAILLANTVDTIRAKQVVHESAEAAKEPSIRIGKLVHTQPRRSVVLIDEIDKAPRDFPNDLLNEMEEMSFQIPELDNTEIQADPALRPVVVITSNSEKNLPDAFLRRCVYYDIPFPDAAQLKKIITNRLTPKSEPESADPRERPLDPEFVIDALALFAELRLGKYNLRKRPATAELLGWLVALRQVGGAAANPLRGDPELVLETIPVLIKTTADQVTATNAVTAWLGRLPPRPK